MAIMGVPGLDRPLNAQDYEQSRQVYGELLNDTLLDGLQLEKYLPPLFEIIDRYNLLEHFCIHSAHTHYALPEGTVRFGTDNRTKPTLVKDLSNKKVHGHIFVVTSDLSLRAYEFRDGDAPDLSRHDLRPFLREFIDYVNKKGLRDLIGLQICDKNIDRQVKWECLDGDESIMTDESTAELKGHKRGRTTGWVGIKEHGRVRVHGNEIHVLINGVKQCYYDQKSVPLDIVELH